MFNIKPPELLTFNNVIVLDKCLKITHRKNKNTVLNENMMESEFIDCLGNA